MYLRFNLRCGKSLIKNPNVQECDATKATFLFLSLVHKILYSLLSHPDYFGKGLGVIIPLSSFGP